jgi:FkbM family methyltransferase
MRILIINLLNRILSNEGPRRFIIRLSRILMNLTLCENRGNLATNGERFIVGRIMRHCGRNDKDILFFDVGANVGEWTSLCLSEAVEKTISERLKIHSFEPSQYTYKRLEETIANHPLAHKVKTVNIGMGSSQKTVTLYINREGAGTNSLYKRRVESIGINYNQSEAIRLTTIAEYCRDHSINHITLLKIDAEGHELAIMRGAEDMMMRHAIDYIQFEYGGCWIDSRVLLMDMYDWATSLGYVIGKIMPKGIELYESYDERLETFQMANYLVCLPDLAAAFPRVRSWME